ncbi:MAG TPA: MBL fold metallo-hydrolase [Gaiellaceae bacterium]|nr:MBL fold metallo-hydrolase [Gaiellaceae bacterium]
MLYRHAKTLVLIDPLPTDDTWCRVGAEVAQADEPVAVLLTAPWHLRGTAEAAARFHARVWAAERAWERLPVLERLERPPGGISPVAPRGVDEGQVAFFLEAERALVVGERFLGTQDGLRVTPSHATTDLDTFVASLRELERSPIQRVLVSHGPPVLEDGGEAIARAVRRFER